VSDSVQEPATPQRAPIRGQRRTIITLVSTVALIVLTLYSVLFFGVTSRNVPTGTPEAVVEVVSAQLTLNQQIPAKEFKVTADISSANKYWAMFIVTPTVAGLGKIQLTYGFYQFADHRWQFRAAGANNVGCATRGSTHVPANVLASFAQHCAASS
jgi:hypothetical protein